VETECSGLRKSCSLRVTSETCGRSRGDRDGQKSMGDRGESQDDMQACWADLDRRSQRRRDASDGGALQEQTRVVEDIRVGGLSCMCGAWRWRHQAVEVDWLQSMRPTDLDG
jgi:hypothetical protein